MIETRIFYIYKNVNFKPLKNINPGTTKESALLNIKNTLCCKLPIVKLVTPSDDVCISTTNKHKNDVNKYNSVNFCFFSNQYPSLLHFSFIKSFSNF